MNVQPTRDQKKAIQKLIIWEQVINWKTALTSLLPLAAILSVMYLTRWYASFPTEAVFVLCLFFVFIGLIIGMQVAGMVIDMIDRLDQIPVADWFSVISVKRQLGQLQPVTTVVFQDYFGALHKLNYSENFSSVSVVQVKDTKSRVAHFFKPKWEPVLEEMYRLDSASTEMQL